MAICQWVFQAKRRSSKTSWLPCTLHLGRCLGHRLRLGAESVVRWPAHPRASGVQAIHHGRAAGVQVLLLLVETIQQRTGSSRLGGVDCIRLNPAQRDLHGAWGILYAAEI